mmetsp:Transcript_40964/g.72034  ORF Transcript_40964/g.72034 Transcript_40964/m.72034 type:complete len:331 (-) Transcript_40964:95-1087(-)
MSSIISASSISRAAKGCDGFICCVGCLSLVPGLMRRVVSQVAFFPPKPSGYHVTDKSEVYLVGADCNLSLLPDLSAEGIAVDTVKMWTRRGNTIMGFHFRRGDATRTMLFSHGNSTDIGIMFHHFRDMCNRLRINLFAYDYSGYGESTGVPSEADLYADIDAAYHYLTSDCLLAEESIVLFGQSVGSVPSIDLATRCECGGMVLHGALKSGLSVIHEVQAMYWFDVFQNAAKIENVNAPVLCIHGTHDSEVPFEHGLALFEACPSEHAVEPWWVKGAGHNDIEVEHRDEYFVRLRAFLRGLDDPGYFLGREVSTQASTSRESSPFQPLLK